MSPVKGFGYLLLIIAAVVTFVRIIVVFAGTTSSFWTSGGWELAMVVLMLVTLLYVLATGFVRRTAEPAPATAGFRDPAVVRFLLNDANSSIFWTVVRWYVGFTFFSAGYAKTRSLEVMKVNGQVYDWMSNGLMLKTIWASQLGSNAKGQPLIEYTWWHNFLNFMLTHSWYTWFAKLVALGELAVGLGLLLGILTGIAAFFGATMNFSYLLTSFVSVNPPLLVLSFALMAAWKVAGWYGGDRWLLPRLGTPWQPGPVVSQDAAASGVPRRR